MLPVIWKSRLPLWSVKLMERSRQLLRLSCKGYPLADTYEPITPFFIIGSGRSGSTLLRSMLIAGGDVIIPPESYVLPRVIRLYSAYSHLPWNVVCSIVIGEFESYKEFYTWDMSLTAAHKRIRDFPKRKRNLAAILDVIYREYGAQSGKENLRWGDKTPINTLYVDKILKVYPDAQFINIVRDPRDVVASYMKAGLYDSVEDAAMFWKACYQKATWLRSAVSTDSLVEVRYEKLVTSPHSELQRVSTFLDIRFQETMMEFWKNSNSLGDVGTHKHHQNVSTPLSNVSIGAWRNMLTINDCNEITRIVGYKVFSAFTSGS